MPVFSRLKTNNMNKKILWLSVLLPIALLLSSPQVQSRPTPEPIIKDAFQTIVNVTKSVGKALICSPHFLTDALKSYKKSNAMMKRPHQVYLDWQSTLTPAERQNLTFVQSRTTDSFATRDVQELMYRFAEYQALSYCREQSIIEEQAAKETRIGNIKIFKSGNDRKGRLAWYLSISEQQKTIVLTNRGTDMTNVREDLWRDLDMLPRTPKKEHLELFKCLDSKKREEYRMHSGFMKHFQAYRDEIMGAITNLYKTYPAYRTTHKFVIVGHSLGAAHGFFTAAHIQSTINSNKSAAYLPAEVYAAYLYAMPRVGNQLFADTLADKCIGRGSNRESRVIRFVDSTDVVPRIPAAMDHPRNVNYIFCTENNELLRCNGPKDPKCDAKYDNDCRKWSWKPHSEFCSFSMRKEFCNMAAAETIDKERTAAALSSAAGTASRMQAAQQAPTQNVPARQIPRGMMAGGPRGPQAQQPRIPLHHNVQPNPVATRFVPQSAPVPMTNVMQPMPQFRHPTPPSRPMTQHQAVAQPIPNAPRTPQITW